MGKTDLRLTVSGLFNLIFPPVCIHCEEETVNNKYPLCKNCVQLLELADPDERCPICFQILKTNHRCDLSIRKAAAFEALAPATTIFHYFQKKHAPGFAPAMASFMVIQLIELGWPLPETVIPLPCSFFQRIGREYEPNKLLAESVAMICGAEMLDCLKSGFDGGFHWKQEKTIADKHVVVVDDGSSGKKIFLRADQCLREGFPKSLKYISFVDFNFSLE